MAVSPTDDMSDQIPGEADSMLTPAFTAFMTSPVTLYTNKAQPFLCMTILCGVIPVFIVGLSDLFFKY